jgi:hypothetical protein
MMKRYLPIQTLDGGWINRVDLYLLARMGYEDDVGLEVVERLHANMCQSSPNLAAFNALDRDLHDRHVNRNLRYRLFAGQTVLELVRIAAHTKKPPSATQAVRLCAFNQWTDEHKRAQLRSLEREVKKAFSEYRNTAHLQAAMVLADPSVSDMENSKDHTLAFLARARGLEIFVDENVSGPGFKWEPWRIPPAIEANLSIEAWALSEAWPLSDEERRAVGMTC